MMRGILLLSGPVTEHCVGTLNIVWQGGSYLSRLLLLVPGQVLLSSAAASIHWHYFHLLCLIAVLYLFMMAS